MKRKDSQPAVATIGHRLVVREHLVHQIAVHAQVRTAPCLPGGDMPAHYHDDVGIFAGERSPSFLSVIVLGHIVRVALVHAGVVPVHIAVRYHNHFLVQVGLHHSCGPVQRRGAWNVFQHQDQHRLAIDVQHAVEVFIAARGIAALII